MKKQLKTAALFVLGTLFSILVSLVLIILVSIVSAESAHASDKTLSWSEFEQLDITYTCEDYNDMLLSGVNVTQVVIQNLDDMDYQLVKFALERLENDGVKMQSVYTIIMSECSLNPELPAESVIKRIVIGVS